MVFNTRTENSKDDLETPDYLFEQLDDRYNFSIDVACTMGNSKVIHYGMLYDGLKDSWAGHRVFCNPPYKNKKEWIRKAIYEVEEGDCPLCIMILPCTMEVLRDTKDYHQEILSYRVSFIDPETKKPMKGNNAGTVIIHFWKKITRGDL